MTSIKARAFWQILIAIFIWAVASIVIKATLTRVHPITFLTYRFFISTVIALPFLPSIIKIFNKPVKTQLLILLYILLAAPISLGILFVGLSETSVTNLSLITVIEPLLITVIASHVFHDKLSHRARIGLFIAVVGILFIISESIFAESAGTLRGNILIILYTLCDMISVFLLKMLMKRNVSPTALTHLSFIMGLVVFLPFMIYQTGLGGIVSTIQNIPFTYQLGIFYMAVLSGTLAYSLKAKAQKTLTVSEICLLGYLSPVISTILAITLLREHISTAYMVGAAILGIGVMYAETRKRKKTS